MLIFDENHYYDQLVENGIATSEEINLVVDINGYSIDTLDDILYARTGNRSWDQYCDENGVENVFYDNEEDYDDYE